MAIYNGKHVVFEQVGLDADTLVYNSSSNRDSDGAYNDWNISNIRNTHLPARLLLLSSALQDNLTNTTIQTATNGTNGALVSTNDKLFIAAQKEIISNAVISRIEESDALTTWSYRTNHTQASDRVKTNPSNVASGWWLRSAYSGTKNSIISVRTDGYFDGPYAYSANCVSLCYAF